MVPETADQPTAPAVLLLAPTGRDAALSADELRRAAVPCIVCPTAEDLIERIRRGGGPAVVVAESLGPRHAAQLQAVLADEPPWSDLPLIVIAGPAAVPRHLHALLARRNTTLLHRPLKVATFVTMTRSALQNRFRQYEIRALLRRLEDRARQLQRLALELIDTEERERQRLADLLHDDLQQILVGAKLQAAGLPKQAGQDRGNEAVAALADLLDQAILQSRSLSHALNSPIVQQHGLAAGLQAMAKQMHALHELEVTVEAETDANPRDGRISTFLYRSAQELLFNVAKHADVEQAHMHLSSAEDHMVLQVQDRGKGFDPSILQEDASGMGLRSIRDRARLFGGRFEARSSEGMGSTFTLSLPLQPAAPPTTAPEQSEAAQGAPASTGGKGESPASRLRIVLADDHRLMRSGLRSILELEPDLEVIGEADDGAQAIELADRLRPNVILMDVSMPRVGGIEATRWVKEHHPCIRVIGVSMFEDEHYASKMRQAGAERYLSKTGPSADLLAAIRSAGEPAGLTLAE